MATAHVARSTYPTARAAAPVPSFKPVIWARALFPQSICLWLAGAWLILVVIRPWEVLFPELEAFRFERVYCIITLVMFLLSGKMRISFTPPFLLLWAFVGGNVLACLFSYQGTSSLDAVYKVGTLVALCLVVYSAVERREDALFLLIAYAVGVTLYLGKCEWEFFFHGRGDYAMGVKRMVGIDRTFAHPNAVAGTALGALPFLYLLYSLRNQFPRSWRWPALAAIGAAFAIAVVAVALTNSRAGMLGVLVFVLLSSVTNRSVIKAGATALVAGLVAVFLWTSFAPEEQQNRLRTLWDSSAGPSNAIASLDEREKGTLAAIETFSRNPLFGVGPNSFKIYRKAEIDGGTLAPHNIFADLLATTGLAGSLPFFSLIALTLWMARLLQKHCRDKRQAEYCMSLAVRNGIFLLLFSGFASTELRANWFLLAGLTAALSERCRTS